MKNREIIIRQALQLFRQYGVKNMSVERLTQELKLSRRALYALFRDKEDLLSACLDLNYREEIAEFSEFRQNGADPLEVFMLVSNRVIEREFSLNPDFYHDILHYYPELRDSAIRRQDNFNRKQLKDLFSEGISQGLICDDTDVRLATEAVIRLYEGLLRAEIYLELGYTKAEMVRKAIRPYLRGICTEAGRVQLDHYLKKHHELISL